MQFSKFNKWKASLTKVLYTLTYKERDTDDSILNKSSMLQLIHMPTVM